jgi:hypothetical protein
MATSPARPRQIGSVPRLAGRLPRGAKPVMHVLYRKRSVTPHRQTDAVVKTGSSRRRPFRIQWDGLERGSQNRLSNPNGRCAIRPPADQPAVSALVQSRPERPRRCPVIETPATRRGLNLHSRCVVQRPGSIPCDCSHLSCFLRLRERLFSETPAVELKLWPYLRPHLLTTSCKIPMCGS